METVYKIVRRGPDGLLRSWKCFKPGVELIYTPGETVRPTIENSLLFAYEDPSFALNSYEPHENEEVWECQAEDTRDIPYIMFYDCDADDIANFWRGGGFGGFMNGMSGALGCTSLTLIRKVEG